MWHLTRHGGYLYFFSFFVQKVGKEQMGTEKLPGKSVIVFRLCPCQFSSYFFYVPFFGRALPTVETKKKDIHGKIWALVTMRSQGSPRYDIFHTHNKSVETRRRNGERRLV